MINIFLITQDIVQYTGRSGTTSLHHSVEDKMHFAVSIRLL
jgi:hypothetical protein